MTHSDQEMIILTFDHHAEISFGPETINFDPAILNQTSAAEIKISVPIFGLEIPISDPEILTSIKEILIFGLDFPIKTSDPDFLLEAVVPHG